MIPDREFYLVSNVWDVNIVEFERFLKGLLANVRKLIPEEAEEAVISTDFGQIYIDFKRSETAKELAKKKAVEEKKRKRELAELARLEKKYRGK